MGSLDFDATNIAPSAPLEVIPSGKYPCRIAETEIKENSKKTGHYLQLTLDVTGGEYKGRKLFDRLNLWNTNGTAVEIAQKTLSAICHAVGTLKVRNHEELCGKAVMVKVTTRNDPQYGESNEVKGYEAAGGQAASGDSWGASAEPLAAAAAVGGETPPWGAR